jgi:ApbE superfamily uncharacterized protein (UPF0280 family)
MAGAGMREEPLVQFLPDGRRLHLRDGPIELIVEAFGTEQQVKRAYEAAAGRFDGLLAELVEELALLREPVGKAFPEGVVARRMHEAVSPFAADGFITPMAAVAGSVAEEILGAITNATDLRRAYVNNGGDIAIHLREGESFAIGLIDRPDRPSLFGKAKISHDEPVRGIATSGWRGRSFSRGIADAVTVIAKTASMADAAATMIANRVDLPDHPAIAREPAASIQPDSDLRELMVTRDVGPLTQNEIAAALWRGEDYAQDLIARGLIHAAALHLQGTTRLVTPIKSEERMLAYA